MSAPLLLLDPESPLSPYEQISFQIRTQIAAGRLSSGDALPSVRQLARDLDVAPNTVVRAYNELEKEGWVVPSARRGVRVAQHLPIPIIEERAHQLQLAVQQLLLFAEQLQVSSDELRAELERQLSVKQSQTR